MGIGENIKAGYIFVFIAVIWGYSFFLTAATGSYFGYNGNWKDDLVFTPQQVEKPEYIYEIDKVIYAFTIQPIVTVIFILSSVILLVGIAYYIIKLIRNTLEFLRH